MTSYCCMVFIFCGTCILKLTRNQSILQRLEELEVLLDLNATGNASHLKALMTERDELEKSISDEFDIF